MTELITVRSCHDLGHWTADRGEGLRGAWEGVRGAWEGTRGAWEEVREAWEGLRGAWEGVREAWEEQSYYISVLQWYWIWDMMDDSPRPPPSPPPPPPSYQAPPPPPLLPRNCWGSVWEAVRVTTLYGGEYLSIYMETNRTQTK